MTATPPTDATETAIRGADAETVRNARDGRDPLPGTAGFAGLLDGALVRDVLGRQPLFADADGFNPRAPESWGYDPADLADPVRVPAGVARTADGDERVWTLPNPEATTDPDEAVARVREAVLGSVRGTGEGGDADDGGADADPGDVADADPGDVAVAFSGGVDSAVVAAGVPEAPCYVAGFPESHDVAAARDAAREMDRDLRVVEVTHADLERAVPELVRATGRTNAMDIQITLPLYLTAEAAAADGHDRLAVGQGADELFGGYAKVVDPAGDRRVDADTVRGARRETMATLPDQLERDVLALRAAGVEPIAPLLHDRVVASALPLSGSLLATPDERKVALRRAVEGVVPDEVRLAEKKAVQYGSLVARELDRLARRAGYKRRMDDHVGQYVRHLAGVEREDDRPPVGDEGSSG